MEKTTTPQPVSENIPPDAPKRSSAGARLLRGLLVLVLMIALGAFAGRTLILKWAESPFGTQEWVRFSIPPGTPLSTIAHELEIKGVIDSSRFFVSYVFLTGKNKSVQAGDYTIALPTSPTKLIERLGHGSFQQKITIPEGWTAAKIERALIGAGWIARDGDWLRVVSEPVPATFFGEEIAAGAEGFCFPDTYLFEKGSDARAIRERMLKHFGEIWKEVRPTERGAKSAGLSTLEVVTLASMIEREARSPKEMPGIASVYLNRLKIKMKLQCCATVRYALGDMWERELTNNDLKADSPYNTYQHAGLPPGPICNPGREAIEAVLRPADTPFLFYVYRGDGTHEFTMTYDEHLKAAKRFKKSDPDAALVEAPAK